MNAHHRICAACVALLLAGTALGEAPSYRDGSISIPSVDSDAQVGQYQNVRMMIGASGAWELNYFASLGEELTTDAGRMLVRDTLYKLPVASVEVVRKTADLPAQVFLRVSGSLWGCASMGRASQRLVDNRFEVLLADGTTGLTYAVADCLADVRPYVKTIPLAVYGLSAGTYSYVVNGEISGSFEIEADNVLGGDCSGSACP